MLNSLRKNSGVRLTAGVAGGVFLGLVGFALFCLCAIAALDVWFQSSQDTREATTMWSIYVIGLIALFFFWRHIYRKREASQQPTALFRPGATGPHISLYLRHRAEFKAATMAAVIAIGIPFLFAWAAFVIKAAAR